MSTKRAISRSSTAEIDGMFTDRWSPRAFDPSPLSQEQLDSLFEAARWSPSCYNEQPWLFLYATSDEDRERFQTVLMQGNQVWANRAPLLMFLVCRKNFAFNDRTNRHASFDAGAAWMSLALQARKLGLYAHAMAGFSREKAYEVLNVPVEEYDIMAAIVVGRRAEPEVLPKELAEKEVPSGRKPRGKIVMEGRFNPSA